MSSSTDPPAGFAVGRSARHSEDSTADNTSGIRASHSTSLVFVRSSHLDSETSEEVIHPKGRVQKILTCTVDIHGERRSCAKCLMKVIQILNGLPNMNSNPIIHFSVNTELQLVPTHGDTQNSMDMLQTSSMPLTE
jgi:hypothetical protein